LSFLPRQWSGGALNNAPCESTIGLFKTEAPLHNNGRTWNNRLEIESQVAHWIHWPTRLHFAFHLYQVLRPIHQPTRLDHTHP